MADKYPLVIAHRGIRTEFPENTVPSIQSALELDVFAVEFDVEMTKDAHLIVLHQETLEPSDDWDCLTHATRQEERCWVHESDYLKVKDLDAGRWMSKEFSGLHIPSLDDVLNLDWGEKRAFIEIKDPYYFLERNEEYEDQILSVLYPKLVSFIKSGGQVSIRCFNEHILSKLAHIDSSLDRLWMLWLPWIGKQDQALLIAEQIDAKSIGLAEPMILQEPVWVDLIQEEERLCSSYPVSPAYDEPEFKKWTAEKRESAWQRLIELGVDMITSDFPRELVEYMKKV